MCPFSFCFHACAPQPRPFCFTSMDYPEKHAVYVSAVSTLNVVFKKKILKKKKTLKDHQIGMGLKSNLIEALSSCSIPTLYIFSHQKYTLLRQPFLSIMNNSVQKHLHADYQKLVSLLLHTHPMVQIPGCVSHLIPISPAFTTNITEKQDQKHL